MPRRLARLGLTVAGALVGGCMAMPISTIVKMATFDENDFFQIDPRQLRVRITSDNDAPLVVDKTRLDIERQTYDCKTSKLAGAMVVESEMALQPERSWLGLGYEPRHVWVLKPDDDFVASFFELQDMARRKAIRRGSVQVDYDFKGRQEAKVVVEVQLSRREGYFTLFDKVKFPPDLPKQAAPMPEDDCRPAAASGT
jgi:hypothetical protein